MYSNCIWVYCVECWNMVRSYCAVGASNTSISRHLLNRCMYISLVTPKTNSFFGRLSFQFSAANDWNELQKSLKLETLISLTSFKHQLSEQLTDYCTCT